MAFLEFDVELFGIGLGADFAGAADEVGKVFAFEAMGGEVFEERADGIGDVLEGDDLFFEAGEPVATDGAADVEGVFAGGTADEADVGVVGTGAAVGAAGHADEDGFLFEAEIRGGWRRCRRARRRRRVRFRRGRGRRWAGRRRRVRSCVLAVKLLVWATLCSARMASIASRWAGSMSPRIMFVLGVMDMAQLEVFGDFAEGGFVAWTAVFEVLDAALGDVDAAEEFAVALFVPAELIGDGVEGVFPWGVKGGVGMRF